MKQAQRGNVIVGIIIGVVLGLAAALAVAVYVTKVPVPFLNKGQSRTPEQDAAESRRNKDWDPNAALSGRNPGRPARIRMRRRPSRRRRPARRRRPPRPTRRRRP